MTSHAPTTWPSSSHSLTMLQFSVDNVHNQNYHVLFAIAVSTAAVELGLTAYLLAAGRHMRGASYNTLFVASRMFLSLALVNLSLRSIVLLFDALWTVLYPSTCVLWSTKGSLDLLANLFGSVIWIFAAAMVWVWPDDLMLCTNLSRIFQGLSIGSVHNARARKSCRGTPLDLK